jgi:hypothetical protein
VGRVADLDLLDLLSADHQNLGTIEQDALVKTILEHLWVERELLHPAIRDHADHGDEIVDTLLALDDRLEDRLADLDDAANSQDPVADDALSEAETEVRAVLSEHIATQEEIFPKLRDSIPAGILGDLAEGVPLAIGGAPTRPHAGRPEGFLGEVAEGVAAATDHLRNLFHRGDRD